MKKICTAILVIISCLALTSCNKQQAEVNNNGINRTLTEKLKETKKIIVKDITEDTTIGTINDKKTIKEILKIINSATIPEGNAITLDGHSLEFEMYNNKSELIDTLNVWKGDKERMVLKSDNTYGYYCIYKENSKLADIARNLRFRKK